MKRFEDPMMDAYREAFSDFQPEVPQGTYAAVRKKMGNTGFWSFGLTSLNVFTVAILLGLGVGAFAMWEWNGGSGVSSSAQEPTQSPQGSIEKIHHHLVAEGVETSNSQELISEELVFQTGQDSEENSGHVYPPLQALTVNSVCCWPSPEAATIEFVEVPAVDQRHDALHEDGVLTDVKQQLEDYHSSIEVGTSSNSGELMDNVKEGKGKTILTLKTKK